MERTIYGQALANLTGCIEELLRDKQITENCRNYMMGELNTMCNEARKAASLIQTIQ